MTRDWHFVWRGILGLALVALAACGDDADDGDVDEQSDLPACYELGHTSAVDWQEGFDASAPGAFLSVWGRGPCDVYTVGGQPDAGAAYRFDGASWKPMPLGASPLLNWVHGNDDTLIVVGNQGVALHAEGDRDLASKDTTLFVEGGSTPPLWGVWVALDGRAWAVGGDAADETSRPVMVEYDGSAWSRVTLPEPTVPSRALFKVWGFGDGKLLAVGHLGVVYRYDGSTWSLVPPVATDDLISLWGTSAEDVTIVGGRSNGVLVHWDGTELALEEPDGVPGLNGVWVDDTGRLTSVGIQGTIVSSAPGGDLERQANPTTLVLHGTWGVPDGPRFAVGGSLSSSPPWTGVVLVDP